MDEEKKSIKNSRAVAPTYNHSRDIADKRNYASKKSQTDFRGVLQFRPHFYEF